MTYVRPSSYFSLLWCCNSILKNPIIYHGRLLKFPFSQLLLLLLRTLLLLVHSYHHHHGYQSSDGYLRRFRCVGERASRGEQWSQCDFCAVWKVSSILCFILKNRSAWLMAVFQFSLAVIFHRKTVYLKWIRMSRFIASAKTMKCCLDPPK